MEPQRTLTSAMQAILQKARDAGVVGAVSGVPTYRRLLASAELIVANGVSAEPLVRTDAHLVASHAREVVVGLKHAMQATHARRGLVALKRSDRMAVMAMSRAIEEDGFAKFHIELKALDPFFPADDLPVLLHLLGNPSGALVFNVHTLYHLAEAQRGQSMTMRLVTITGQVQTPKTLWAPLGTPLSALVEAAGGPVFDETPWLLLGGPLRGRVQADLEGVLRPELGTIAVLPGEHNLVRHRHAPLNRELRRAQSVCNQCARCTEICPSVQRGSALRPHKIMRSLHLEMDSQVPLFESALDCTACNLCTFYACREALSPGRIIAEIRDRQMKSGLEAPPAWLAGKVEGVPLGRLVKRLGLSGLDHLAPWDPKPFHAKKIELLLSATQQPTVRPGDYVSFGQIVARPIQEDEGVPLHASLAGVVKSLDEAIVIEETI